MQDSPVRNIRPAVIRNRNKRIVLWQRGDFQTYRNYQLDPVGFIETTHTSPAWNMSRLRKTILHRISCIWSLPLCLVLPSLLQADPPNVLLICVDDLRPELGCYGADYIQSPNIDRLAEEGRMFTHHYVQVPTCGASRYTLLTGQYGPSDNGALAARADAIRKGVDFSPSLPEWFREHGYTTVAIGKVSHYPGGLGGRNWADPDHEEVPNSWDRSYVPTGPWQHPRGVMHGLAKGEIRENAGDMDVFQSTEGEDTIYPDGLIKEAALKELAELGKEGKPFFLAVGFIRPHLPLGAPAKYRLPYADGALPPIPHPDKPEGQTTWHKSNECFQYNHWGKDPREDAVHAEEMRKHYAACVTYVDEQIGQVLAMLETEGLEDDTIVVLWGDHGWHLGEHAIWGKHSLFEESLHAPLIIKAPDLNEPGHSSAAVVETLSIYPTLCDLAGLPTPASLHGPSLLPQLADPLTPGYEAVSYFRNAETVRTPRYRLIAHKNGYYELYDHQSPERETRNIAAEHPELVSGLDAILKQKTALREGSVDQPLARE